MTHILEFNVYFDSTRVLIHCSESPIKLMGSVVEYIKYTHNYSRLSTYRYPRFFISSHFCRKCGKRLFDDKTVGTMDSIYCMAGWNGVREYLRILVEGSPERAR